MSLLQTREDGLLSERAGTTWRTLVGERRGRRIPRSRLQLRVKRKEQALVILAWVVGATGVPTIPNTHEATDVGTQTLRLWYGTAQAAQATVQQITLITLTSTVSAGYYSNEYEAAVVEHYGWQPYGKGSVQPGGGAT